MTGHLEKHGFRRLQGLITSVANRYPGVFDIFDEPPRPRPMAQLLAGLSHRVHGTSCDIDAARPLELNLKELEEELPKDAQHLRHRHLHHHLQLGDLVVAVLPPLLKATLVASCLPVGPVTWAENVLAEKYIRVCVTQKPLEGGRLVQVEARPTALLWQIMAVRPELVQLLSEYQSSLQLVVNHAVALAYDPQGSLGGHPFAGVKGVHAAAVAEASKLLEAAGVPGGVGLLDLCPRPSSEQLKQPTRLLRALLEPGVAQMQAKRAAADTTVAASAANAAAATGKGGSGSLGGMLRASTLKRSASALLASSSMSTGMAGSVDSTATGGTDVGGHSVAATTRKPYLERAKAQRLQMREKRTSFRVPWEVGDNTRMFEAAAKKIAEYGGFVGNGRTPDLGKLGWTAVGEEAMCGARDWRAIKSQFHRLRQQSAVEEWLQAMVAAELQRHENAGLEWSGLPPQPLPDVPSPPPQLNTRASKQKGAKRAKKEQQQQQSESAAASLPPLPALPLPQQQPEPLAAQAVAWPPLALAASQVEQGFALAAAMGAGPQAAPGGFAAAVQAWMAALPPHVRSAWEYYLDNLAP